MEEAELQQQSIQMNQIEIEETLKGIKVGRASGEDNIKSVMIIEAGEKGKPKRWLYNR